jgi:hypothetical protein
MTRTFKLSLWLHFSRDYNQSSTAIDTNIIPKIRKLPFSYVVRVDLSQ